MKWGRRQGDSSSSSTSLAPKPPPSEDAVRTSEYKQRAASGGSAALTTKQLQELVNRQNLEQQYSKLNQPEVSAGKKLMGELLPSVGKIGYESYRAFYPTPAPDPMSTELRRTSGRQKVGDMLLNTGKGVIKEHGVQIGMMAVAAIVKTLV